MNATQNVIDTLIMAGIVPLGLLLTLLTVRTISYIWYVLLNRRPLPIIVHDISSGWDSGESTHQAKANGQQSGKIMQELPNRLRDYISADPPLSRQLVPGVTGAASASIATAAPDGSQFGWTAALTNLVLPQKEAAYNLIITPHHQESDLLCVNVRIVKTPEQKIVTSRTFSFRTIAELTSAIGGFCMETVQLEPQFLRRTPRWEHWGTRGSYTAFRRAVSYQEDHKFRPAHHAYEKASALSPSNIRLGVYRASLYEIEGKYREATMLYDALHCLWKKNIEVLYRASAARVNQAQEIRFQQQEYYMRDTLTAGTGVPEAEPVTGKGPLTEAMILIAEAQRILRQARADLRYLHVLRMWLITWLPRHRDIGERRYWASWLRRDSFRQPLILLRRSKRYEYVNAIKVAILANEVLHLLLDGEPNETFDIDRSIESLTKLIKRKRIGWLAHWTAACYFSRAAEAAELVTPRAWEKYERRFRAFGSPLSAPAGSSTSWQECCEEMAIGEIGRVLRNPCNQLNPALFHTDPDMRRLHNAFKAGAVRVLIGPLENI